MISCENNIHSNTIANTSANIEANIDANFASKQKRAASITLTDFLSIGRELDTINDRYIDLTIDSVFAIDYMNEPTRGKFPTDTIKNISSLNQAQIDHVVKIIDSDDTYEYDEISKCFNPHMTFVFFKADKIIAIYTVCLSCTKIYSSLKSRNKKRIGSISESGSRLFSEICYEHNFSNCKY
jgi:hypothetical protein